MSTEQARRDSRPPTPSGRVEHALGRPGAPQWIGELMGGVLVMHRHSFGTSAARSRLKEDCRRVSRLFSSACIEQDRRLSPGLTGRLIRVVAQGHGGAAYCFPIVPGVPGQHVVGFLVGAEPVDARFDDAGFDRAGEVAAVAVAAADGVMIDLSDRLREDIGLGSLDPGGLTRPGVPARYWSERIVPPRVVGETEGSLFAAARDAADPVTLHWVAHVRGRSLTFAVDHFDALRDSVLLEVLPADGRRRFYEEVATGAEELLGALGRQLRDVIGGPVVRLSLDVELGVIVVRRLAHREHLVGVTLFQDQVQAAETRVDGIAGRYVPPSDVREVADPLS